MTEETIKRPTTVLKIPSRAGSRRSAASKMEVFVKIINKWKPVTIVTKNTIFDLSASASDQLYIICKVRIYIPLYEIFVYIFIQVILIFIIYFCLQYFGFSLQTTYDSALKGFRFHYFYVF